MVILSRPEKERLVLDLYSQGKTYKQIAQEVRISPRDIGLILKKAASREKDKGEEDNKQNENNNNNKNTLSAQAYKLLSEGKSPIEVDIALNLRQSETERLYKEYWKLKQLYALSRVYQEVKDDIVHFLDFYKMARAEGMGPEEVIKLLEIANNKNGRGLKRIENRYESLKWEINSLELRRLDCKKNLRELQNQVRTFGNILDSFKLKSDEQERKLIWLLEENKALENLVEYFKNNDKEYQKIKQTVEQKANDLLSDKKLVLKLALICVIESMRNNKDKYNYLINGGTSTAIPATGFGGNNNHLSFYKQQPQPHPVSRHNDDVAEIYKSLVLEEAEKFYQQLVSRLTNSTISEAAFCI